MDNDPCSNNNNRGNPGSNQRQGGQQQHGQQRDGDQETPSILFTEQMRFLMSQQNTRQFQPQQFQEQPQQFQSQHSTVTSNISFPSASSSAARHPGVSGPLPFSSRNIPHASFESTQQHSSSHFPMSTAPEIIETPGPHDVLLGRGGETNNHSGNIKFRNLVLEYRDAYNKASKIEKPSVARELVAHWRGLNPPGRFLGKLAGPNSAFWHEVGDKDAQKRASKSLGEREKPSKKGSSTGSLSSQNSSSDAAGQKRPRENTKGTTKTDEILKRARRKMQQQKKKSPSSSHQPANPAASASVGDIYGSSNSNLSETSGTGHLSADPNPNPTNDVGSNPITGGLLPTAAELAGSVFNSSSNSSSSPDSGSANGGGAPAPN